MPKVLVIVPAYNEAETVADVLRDIHTHNPDYDVVVIDDGSLDDTAAQVRRVEGAVCVSLPYNLGIGSAMQTGYLYAARKDYDVAVQCDADGQHPADSIGRLVDHVLKDDADLIIGSRYVKNTDYRPSLIRRIGKSLLSRIADRLVGGGITDTTSGFRAANRKVIDVFARHYPDDYPEPESLVMLHKAGLRCAEVSVVMRPRQGGKTSIHPHRAAYYMIKVGLAMVIHLFRDYGSSDREASE